MWGGGIVFFLPLKKDILCPSPPPPRAVYRNECSLSPKFSISFSCFDLKSEALFPVQIQKALTNYITVCMHQIKTTQEMLALGTVATVFFSIRIKTVTNTSSYRSSNNRRSRIGCSAGVFGWESLFMFASLR